MKNKEEETLLLNVIPQKGNNARVLQMTEKGEVLGYVAIDLKDEYLRFLHFEIYADPNFTGGEMREMFMDSLMRSAASYGEVNGATKICTLDNKNNAFFEKRGFTVDENHAFGEMDLIVKYKN